MDQTTNNPQMGPATNNPQPTTQGAPAPEPIPQPVVPQTPPTPPTPPPTQGNGSSVWPLVAVVIVLALVIVGALFFWQSSETAEQETREEAEANALVELISTQSSSDTTPDLEADLNSTDVESIDAELNNI